MSTTEFYREQAAKDMALAAEATLPAVRARCERSAAAWQVMADRQANHEAQRSARLAERSTVEA
jgi:hypothetical protein